MNIRKLLGLCEHQWKIIHTAKVYCLNEQIGHIHTLQCTKCGKITSKKVTV